MDKLSWTYIILALTVIQITLLWCIDISVSAMINDGMIVRSLIYSGDATIMYHIGLVGTIAIFFIQAMIILAHVVKIGD